MKNFVMLLAMKSVWVKTQQIVPTGGTNITKFGSSGGVFFKVTEYYIEENEYDDDGEWISGGDIWKFSKMPSEYEK